MRPTNPPKWGGGYLFEYQVIAVDDGSVDSSLELLKELARLYSNLKVLHKENSGAAAARKFGIENSESDYLAFCDSDDYVEPDWLLTMYQYLIKYDADISMIGAFINDKNLETRKEEPYTVWEWNRDQSYRMFLEHKHLNGILWTNLFKRELFDDIEWNTEITIYEDGFLIWQILEKVNKIVKVLTPKYHYMYNSDSLTNRQYDFNRYKAYRTLTDRIVNDCKNKEQLRIYFTDAVKLQCKWTYQNLSSMVTSTYSNKDAQHDMLEILRQNAKITVFEMNGLINKLRAMLLMINPQLYKFAYKVLK